MKYDTMLGNADDLNFKLANGPGSFSNLGMSGTSIVKRKTQTGYSYGNEHQNNLGALSIKSE